MKTFAEWFQNGPLAGLHISERERQIAQVAYNEAAMQANDQLRASMERILQGEQPAVRAGHA